MNDKILPESQFDPIEKRDSSNDYYTKALAVHQGSEYIRRDMDHLEMALAIRRVARLIESTKKFQTVSPIAALAGVDKHIGMVYEDGTWEGYRKFIIAKYNVDMGPVPENAEKPSLEKIEGTIQNWLNGEPLLFY